MDPNGVLYFPFKNFDTEGVVGIRPHPLPPSWLALSAWDGELEAGESTEITLTFSAGTRAVGNTYSAVLQVFEAATGAALEVPLAFEVAPPVDAGDGAAAPAEVSLTVYPNPTRGQTTVALALPTRTDLRLVVYDVLGREVARFHDAPVEAGQHTLRFDTAGWSSGVYLVRATGNDFNQVQRIVLTQ